MYEIRYFPLSMQDLEDIATYIAEYLKSPKAAIDLLNALDKSISKLGQFPYACKLYHSSKNLKKEYRLLIVENYVVLYTIKEQVVEIYRVIYAKKDFTKIIM